MVNHFFGVCISNSNYFYFSQTPKPIVFFDRTFLSSKNVFFSLQIVLAKHMKNNKLINARYLQYIYSICSGTRVLVWKTLIFYLVVWLKHTNKEHVFFIVLFLFSLNVFISFKMPHIAKKKCNDGKATV